MVTSTGALPIDYYRVTVVPSLPPIGGVVWDMANIFLAVKHYFNVLCISRREQ